MAGIDGIEERATAMSTVTTYEATVSEDGTITLPEELRRELGVEPGGTIRFQVDDRGRVSLRVPPKRLEDVLGYLVAKGPTSVDLDEEIEEAMAIELGIERAEPRRP